MYPAQRSVVSELHRGWRRLLLWHLAVLVATGCQREPEAAPTSVLEPPTVTIVRPSLRNIVRVVEQPSFIEAYERTSIFPKVTGYIEEWNVDIGDKVKKGQTLATLFVPEMVEDFGTKKATVKLDQERLDMTLKMVAVAEADVKTARAQLAEAKSILASYQSEVDRWDTEVSRLRRETERGIVDPQVLLETTNQWKSTGARRDAAKATIQKADAELLSKEAILAKAKVDVAVARADLNVARSEERRMKAWVGYLTLQAPYNGVIVARNANTFDFVLPEVGDPSAMQRAPFLSHSGAAAPIYVVDRTDVVRIFVDIPEQDANFVHAGTKATVLVQAYRDEPIDCTVTRTAWALDVKSRTLRAEIDLPNPGSQLLPGMYAYSQVVIERPRVRAVPLAALTYRGNQAFYWAYASGKAVRTEAQTGVSDGEWIEITKRRVWDARTSRGARQPWRPIDGSEQVILGDLAILAQGAAVRVAPPEGQTNVAKADSERGAGKGALPRTRP